MKLVMGAKMLLVPLKTSFWLDLIHSPNLQLNFFYPKTPNISFKTNFPKPKPFKTFQVYSIRFM